jgi:hypothetical protein
MERPPGARIGRFKIVKMAMLLKVICSVNGITNKIPVVFFMTIKNNSHRSSEDLK